MSGWSFPCPDLEAEDAEDRRMALVLITELWTRHPFSSNPHEDSRWFVFNQLHRHSLRGGWLPGKEQEAPTDLLLKAGEGPVQEFVQVPHG